MGPEAMVGFGGKQAWLAVRDGEPGAVLAALGLRDLGPVSWRQGVDLAHLTDDRVVVTPPLPGADGAGWVLAAGRRLLHPAAADAVALSGALHTRVQAFATHRVDELHRWLRADDGTLLRAFSFLGSTGEVLVWQGDPDPAERAAGLPAAPPGDEGGLLVGERDVFAVAAAWSVDPTTLDGRPAPGPVRVGAAG